jgi:hypothetical protein
MTVPPPCNPELEREVLGAGLHSATLAQHVAALPLELFFVEAHRDLARVLAHLAPSLNGTAATTALVLGTAHTLGVPVDPILLMDASEDGLHVVALDTHVATLRALASIFTRPDGTNKMAPRRWMGSTADGLDVVSGYGVVNHG